MKVLVTGANGFLGQNLCLELKNQNIEFFAFDKQNTIFDLEKYIASADFVAHLAGVNRSSNKTDFYDGNSNFTVQLIETIKKSGRNIPILFASTIQVGQDNDYAKSKKIAEEKLKQFSEETENPLNVVQLANVFGKWSRPNYNSVIATFCYNISRNLDICVSNAETEVSFIYIDDVIKHFMTFILGKAIMKTDDFSFVEPTYKIKLGRLAELLKSFKEGRSNFSLPTMDHGFETKLYATYLTYLDENDFSYALKTNEDARGSFTEFIKTSDAGQISVNITKPGITKGNHWHQTKTEKFLVVSGEAIIKFRKVGSADVFEYKESGTILRVVDIPCGYVHSITNIGTNDLITIMWSSEPFNPNEPDTYFMEVEKNE